MRLFNNGGSLRRWRTLGPPAVLLLLLGLGVAVGQPPATTRVTTPDAAAPHLHAPAWDIVPAAVAEPLPVSRARWTAPGGAGSQAAAAFDDDPDTVWNSAEEAPPGRALPHSFVIDMNANVPVAGLTYLPRRANGNGNGLERRIAQFRIELSDDGATWSEPVATGTFADDDTLKSTTFTPQLARFVRLTALTPAGGGMNPVSAAEINVLAAADLALPRTGWTATASSFENVSANTPPGNVLDGSTATMWHSKYSAPADALPNDITIDMKATKTVTGLSYLPRQDASPNGRIGQYRIDVSANGTSWTAVSSGTWADSNVVKTVTFTGASARYVRLTALTEAGARGQWTSAAEINIHGSGTTTTPSTGGRWGAPITFPLVPVAAAMLPNGRLLTWSSHKADSFGGSGLTVTATYNPVTGAVTQRTVTNTGHDMFCPGISALPDGRVLVSGGDDAGKSSIYNATTDTWTTGPALAIARAYQSTTTLSDGRVFSIGGSWRGGQGGKHGEIWSATGGWQKLSSAPVTPMLTADRQGVYRADNHAWLFGWSGGRVLQAGPSKAMNWYGTTGNGSVTAAGARAADPDAMNGTAVMYDAGKILTLGGAPHYQDSSATANAHVISISGTSTVTTRKVGSMAYARAYHNSVVLPDGKVLVVGGQAYAVPFSDNTSVRNAELWDPATETFTTMAAAGVPRNYHSVAALLPDGRVFAGGSGLCGTCSTNHFNGEIFTPPYLLNSDGTLRSRPAITSAPATATYGAAVTVATDRAVSRFSLVRLGTATHTVNTDQRRIGLTPTAVTGGYQLSIPTDPGVVLPGYYMLFALDANGVPSVSRTIQIR
ncbi:MAG TPA: discoidin domain-containing protein [Pilimelia sp.]|nr:discoidin domain-containing protein [Pilimelia sp.]